MRLMVSSVRTSDSEGRGRCVSCTTHGFGGGHTVIRSILRERGGQPTTSIVDLCVHRPKSDLLRSVVKGGGGGVETDVCGGENSCTMYSTKRGEKRRNESMVAPTEKHGNGHRGREGNNSKTSGPRTRWNGVAHASSSWRGKSSHKHERGKCGSEESMTAAAIRRGGAVHGGQ